MSPERRPAVDGERFLAAARQIAAAVTVATASDGRRSHAVTATAFCTLSLDPPMVLVALDRAGKLLRLVRAAGHIGVNILGRDQQHVGEWAATRGRQMEASLPGLDARLGMTGAPLLGGVLAWFDCEVDSETEHGDHAIVVARVIDAWAGFDGEPLVYHRGRYRSLAPGLEDRVDPA